MFETFFFKSKINLAIMGLFFLGLFLLAVGGGLLVFRNSSSDDIQIISSDSANVAGEIVVHVDGAVVAPGVYKLAVGARVADAIKAAAGLTKEADQAKINLAAKVTDGQKIYVFAKDEQVISDKGQAISQSSLININTASESELDKLPQVGPVTAGKIIASRPYSASEDLLTKKVVSRSVFEKIKEMITY